MAIGLLEKYAKVVMFFFNAGVQVPPVQPLNGSQPRGIDWTLEIRFSKALVTSKSGTLRVIHRTSPFLLTMLVQVVVSCTAFAQTESVSRTTFSEKSKHSFYGQLRLEGMQYLTALPEAPHLSYSQFLSAQVSYVGETSWFENALDIGAGTFFSRSQSHFAVHELYTSPRTDSYRVYVGRKLNAWSEMDRDWNMGVWQPFFEIDALRPEEQGLTGLFLDVNRKDFQVLAFWTPLFIPSMGPEIREENGALISDSRWYRSPSQQVEFINKPLPISYQLSIPEVAELANHGGAGAMGRLGDKDQGPWVVTSYGYTPVNKLILKRNIRKPISDLDVGVIVSPEVTYHRVFSTDVGYTLGNLKAHLSYLQDEPETVYPEPDWAIQKLSGIRAYAVGVDWRIPKFFTHSLLLQLDYLYVTGGQIEDIVHSGEKDEMTLATHRMNFTNAVKVKAQGEIATIFKGPLVTKLSWLYDRDQKGSMINSEFLYYPKTAWALVMGADFLGADDENHKTSGFLNQYRANDRVYGGMTYVF